MAFLRAVKVAFKSSCTTLLFHLLFVNSDLSLLMFRSVERPSSTSVVDPVHVTQSEQIDLIFRIFSPANKYSVEYYTTVAYTSYP